MSYLIYLDYLKKYIYVDKINSLLTYLNRLSPLFT